MMTNQALGWKELQQMPLPLLIYVVSDLVRIPEGQRKLLFMADSSLYFLGCEERACTFSSLLKGFSLGFLSSSQQG